MIPIGNEQREDLVQLHDVAEQFETKPVIIGAAALACFMDLQRLTADVDLVVALDIEDFTRFRAELTALGWQREPRLEHRWHGPRGSLIDLLPAGPQLLAAQRIVWPDSQFVMSLVGFEHVFTRAVTIQLTEDATVEVIPPPVVALLKIVAYMDNQRRKKDITDISVLLRQYEAKSDRIFGDEVFDAELEDIEYANAFLLGMDTGAIATEAESTVIENFLRAQAIADEDLLALDPDDLDQRNRRRWHLQLRVFEQGLRTVCSRDRLRG